MITDFHTHIFPEKIAAAAIDKLSRAAHIRPFLDASAASLLSSMEQSGVGRSLLLPVATAARQVEKLTDSAAILNERYADPGSGKPRLLSFGAMHPDFEGWKNELSRMRELGLKGFKLHPLYQEKNIDDISYLRIFERAAELDLIVLTQAGYDIGYPGVVHCSPQMCRHVCEEIGPFKFILAHMGGWRNWDEVPELLADTGACIDTAFSTEEFPPLPDGYWDDKSTAMLDAEESIKIIRAFGSDHVLFGTDSPWSDQKQSLEFMKKLPLSREELDNILCNNAERLLG